MGSSIISKQDYPEFLTSTRISFVLFAILSFLGAIASLVGGNKRE
jgi:hypothetical protein